MPALDWDEIRTIARTVGIREAGRRAAAALGLSARDAVSMEERVKRRCSREGWLKDLPPGNSAPARVIAGAKQVVALMSPLVPKAEDLLDYRQHGKPARLALAAAQRRQAERLATMDEDELIQPEVAGVMVASAKVGNTLHGWSGSAQPATIRLELLARGAGNGPVIDSEMVVDAQLVEGDDDQG